MTLEIEALRDEPALRLALNGLALRERPLGDEEHLPAVAKHQLVDAANGGGIEGPQRGPEVWRSFDRLPDRAFTAACLLPPGSGRGDCRRGGGLPFFFCLGIVCGSRATDFLAGGDGPNSRTSCSRNAREKSASTPSMSKPIRSGIRRY